MRPMLEMTTYFRDLDKTFHASLADKENQKVTKDAVAMLMASRRTTASIPLIGNGSSATIARHIAVDLSKTPS